MAVPQVRKLLKSALGLVRGSSSPAIESHITTSARSIVRTEPKDVLAKFIESGERPATWTDEFLKGHYEVPVPIPVKETQARGRPWQAVAFDKYMVLNRDSIETLIDEAGLIDDGEGKDESKKSKMKKIGWMRFSKLDQASKKTYLPEGWTPSPKKKKADNLCTDAESPAGSSSDGHVGSASGVASPSDTHVGAAVGKAKTQTRVKRKEEKLFAAIGRAFVDTTGDVMLEGENRERSVARVLFAKTAKAAEEHGISKRRIHNTLPGYNSQCWRDCYHAGGRPKGSFVVKDSELKEALQEFTADCSRYSRRCKTTFRHLQVSKRRAAFKLKQKGLPIARRQLARRMLKGRLGISVGFRRSDDCHTCRTWRFKVAPKLQSFLEDGKQKCKVLCADVWEKPEPFRWEDLDVESPEFLKSLRHHCLRHSETCQCEAGLSLQSFIDELDKKEDLQGEWAWHWWHAKTLNGEMHKMWNEPEEKVLYILIDYEDLPP